MTALTVLAIIAAVVVTIGFIRIRLAAKYDADGFKASGKIAWFRFDLYPRAEKKPPPAKEDVAKKEKPPREKKTGAGDEKPGIIERLGGLREVINFALEAVADFFDMVYTDLVRVKFVSAKKDDPASAAKTYGYAWAIAGIIIPFLENNKNVKSHLIEIDLDFEAEKMTIEGELKISVSIGRIVRFGFSKATALLVKILKNRKKGGAVHGKAGKQYA